jgi:hypothetical protein
LSLLIVPLAGCGQAAVDPAARYKWRDHRQVGIVLSPGFQLSVDAEGSTDKKATVAGLTLTTNCEVEFGTDGTLLIGLSRPIRTGARG